MRTGHKKKLNEIIVAAQKHQARNRNQTISKKRPRLNSTMVFRNDKQRLFCFPFMFDGAECKVTKNFKYTVQVQFDDNIEKCLVSPDYLETKLVRSKRLKQQKKSA